MSKTRMKTQDIVYIAIGATLLAVCSQISIPAAIPFTLQTFAAAFVGGFLGVKKGVSSVVIYILLGVAGIPVFAGFRSGIPTLLGGTGGYIIGLLPFAAIAGFFAERFRGKLLPMVIGMLLGLISCYILGTAWYVHLYAEKGLAYAISACVLQFIIPDIIKIAVAALLVKRIAPIVRK